MLSKLIIPHDSNCHLNMYWTKNICNRTTTTGNSVITLHSALIRNLIKLKGTAKLTAQGEWICLRHSKYILFEILAHRTWKGSTSACRLSQPNCQIRLSWLAGAQPFHVLFARISNKIYLESLRHIRSPCAVSFAVYFNFIRFLISTL